MWPHLSRQSIRTQQGLLRSVLMYYAVPGRNRQLMRFYRHFVGPGDLCFDIGAHVGNRVRAWRGLGAKVVAVEPQPICLDFLRRWFGDDPSVILVDQAVGAQPGRTELFVSSRTPTVTSMSRAWIESVQQADSFAGVDWDAAVEVEVTTLDALVARYGRPAFCKIDVEGYEHEVLLGLSRPVPALSVEYIPAALAVTHACITRLAALGGYEFNWTVGERHQWRAPNWTGAGGLLTYLDGLEANSNSGDIYARLRRLD